MDMLEPLRGAVVISQRIIEGVRPDQFGASTPCTEYDVRGLMGHMIGGASMLAAILAGQTPGEAPDFGDDPAGASKQAIERLLFAFEAPGIMEQEFNFGMGPMPGARVAGIAIMESVVHGWDLARATGQEHGIPDGLAEAVLENVRKLPEAMRGDQGAPFRPPVPIADDAPAADRLAAFLGRQV